jgi:ribosomal protein L28
MKGKPMRKAMITKSFIIEETNEQVDIEVSADVELRNIQKRKEACEKVRKCVK